MLSFISSISVPRKPLPFYLLVHCRKVSGALLLVVDYPPSVCLRVLRCVRTTIWIQSGLNLDRLKLNSIHINRVRTILRSVARAPRYPHQLTPTAIAQRIVSTRSLVVLTRRLRTAKRFFIGATGRLIHCKPVTVADLDQAAVSLSGRHYKRSPPTQIRAGT